jgi:hypothetical protein
MGGDTGMGRLDHIKEQIMGSLSLQHAEQVIYSI